ncbi:MAG TPA: TIGR04282 family arsenosugar biosynthesis glycosyltransferase [Candidatus Angelobacter sp.]|nr:TIGR04282 family arsenosugar biosynthesis glycosyltransferase [Candidatus Angelobacter sp.]
MGEHYSRLSPDSPSPSRSGACALAVMAKAPRIGDVKTRLVPPLDPAQAAGLNICFLRDLTTLIADLVHSDPACQIDGFVAYTPVGSEEMFNGLLPNGFGLLAQRGRNLGERLSHAAHDFLNAGYGAMCLINSDSPTLPKSVLEEAVKALQLPGDRVVLGPADDGGYYLIGLKKAHPQLFADIEWSTEKVLAQTLERAAQVKLEVVLLPVWYDVDDGNSLERLCDELFGAQPAVLATTPCGYHAPHTRAYLTQLNIESDGRARRQAAGEPGL